MTLNRLFSALALAVLSLAPLSLATPAAAGSHNGVGRQGLPLDPELLPSGSGPGDCVVRRVTGPGGAYRWERIECASQRSWSSHDQWGYGRSRLDVETRDGRPPLLGGCGCDGQAYDGYAYGGRYGDDRQRQGLYERRVDGYDYERSRAYDSGYVGGAFVGGSYAGGSYAGGYADGRYSGGGYVSGGYDQGGYAQGGYSQQGYGQSGDGYGYERREDRYGPGPGYAEYGYGGAAGRDQDGYLVWPGKLP